MWTRDAKDRELRLARTSGREQCCSGFRYGGLGMPVKLSGGVSLLALTFAAQAQAQTQTQTGSATGTPAVSRDNTALVGASSSGAAAQSGTTAPATSSTPSDPNAGASTGEIVVTALRQSQTLQRTPAAVTVVTGDLLQRQQIFDIRGIQNLAPSARFSAANTSTRIYIRGVGSALDFYWIPETTAVNLNGVYVPRFATTGGFFDVDSVQVLPGPQGVLYGRSAGGGAVVINTKRPVNRNEASGRFEYGNYDAYRLEGMGNLALTSTLAMRAAFVISKHSGYQTFGLDADNSFSARLSALWKPVDGMSIFLWGTHFEQKGKPTAANYIPFVRADDAWFIPQIDPFTKLDNSTGSRNNYKYTIGGADVQYRTKGVTIDYTGAVLRQTELSVRKLVGNNQVVNNGMTQFTQALHFSGSNGPLDWIMGVDWFYAKSRYDVRFGPRQLGTIFPNIKQRSLSGFAQGTYSVAPTVRLVAGGRYTRDSLFLNGTGSACFGPCVYPPISFNKAWKHLDVKGGVEADVARHVLGYANIQTGYAPGTLNTFTNAVGLNKEIKPQTLLAYTAGLKSTLNEGHVTLNVEGFHYSYKKLIIQAFNAAIGQQTLYNAPTAKVYGAQFTSAFRPTPKDTITANVAYTHSAYGHFVAGPGQVDLNGLQLVFTPTWTASLSYDRRFDLANGARVDARVSSYLSSSYWGTFDHSSLAFQDDYSKTDASLTYHAPSDRFSIGGWIKNIGNEAVKTALTSSGNGPPFPGATFLEPPRTYGVSLGLKM